MHMANSNIKYYSTATPTQMPSSRPTTPATTILPFRFSSQSETTHVFKRSTREDDLSSSPPRRTRKSSTHSMRKTSHSSKGKDPASGKKSVDSSTSPDSSSTSYDADPFAAHYNTTTSFTSYETSRPSTAEGSPGAFKRSRGSLLIVATDALSFTFGRRRKSIKQPALPMPIILPDVIEISAPRRDEEVEERERLRDMAAQSIGLGPVLRQEAAARSMEEALDNDAVDVEESSRVGEARTQEHIPNGRGSPLGLNTSLLASPPSPQPLMGRHRASSTISHNRSNSISPASVPPFPSTPSSLIPFTQSSSALPKYYPPASLRIFALSKHWKNRFMVLSSPITLLTRGAAPTVSYLHLFKSPGAEEKELERLEINEESVVFVAEEEVGGRRHVVKVGGTDVGAMRKEMNHEEGGRTMWFLQLTDPAEAQKWIAMIKNAILGQRSVRAGLGMPAHTLGGIEPRGDMDVMLSMRSMQAQGMITSPTQAKLLTEFTGSRPVHASTTHASQVDAASVSSAHSVHSQATVPKPTSNGGAVSALKGLFGGTRPRSASRAASIESDRETVDESFGSMGSNLLSMIRPNPTDVSIATPKLHPQPYHSTLPFAAPASPEFPLERKITERLPEFRVTEPVKPKVRATRAMSLGGLSLQPPPRKRWTSNSPVESAPQSPTTLYQQTNGNNSVAGSFGIDALPNGNSTDRPRTPSLSGLSFGVSSSKPRPSSIQSVSTIASAENGTGLARSNSSTKRTSSMKRWSRQGTLPRRLTPPSGPPPSIPSDSSRLQLPHPYSAERPPSPSSSVHSGISVLPNFSKRASVSSAHSINTVSSGSASHSHSHSHTTSFSVPRPSSSHRASMPPPPRPAPTTALPPAPDQELPKAESAPVTKTSFRDSVAHRAFRLSLIAPKPPPSTVLPPRPDEPEFRTHRRSSSGSSRSPSLHLYSIPGSPVPASPTLAIPPYPPPNGPLPPPPSQFSPPVSRHTSIKQRLRILSAPSPSAPAPTTSLPPPPTPPFPVTPTIASLPPPPATPIGEKITHMQDDPSFLQLLTPVTPSLPIPKPRNLPSPIEQYPEVTSLSPPPRRGSKQISITDSTATDTSKVEPENSLLSLSRRGSVISLGIVSM